MRYKCLALSVDVLSRWAWWGFTSGAQHCRRRTGLCKWNWIHSDSNSLHDQTVPSKIEFQAEVWSHEKSQNGVLEITQWLLWQKVAPYHLQLRVMPLPWLKYSIHDQVDSYERADVWCIVLCSAARRRLTSECGAKVRGGLRLKQIGGCFLDASGGSWYHVCKEVFVCQRNLQLLAMFHGS